MAYKLRFLLPLAAVLATGCGGTGSTKTLTRAQLIAQADPICASASAKRKEARARLGKAASFASPQALTTIAKTAPGLAAYEREAVSKLGRLNAPTSLAHDWQSMLAGLQRLANDTAQLGAYAKEKNVKQAEKLTSGSESTRKQLLAIAGRDGFKNCGYAD